jgi:hypothetical protein
MIGRDLIVEIPWIAFGLSLAAICLRLRRFRRFTGRSRNHASRTPSDDDNGGSADNNETCGNAHHATAASAPARQSSTRP